MKVYLVDVDLPRPSDVISNHDADKDLPYNTYDDDAIQCQQMTGYLLAVTDKFKVDRAGGFTHEVKVCLVTYHKHQTQFLL